MNLASREREDDPAEALLRKRRPLRPSGCAGVARPDASVRARQTLRTSVPPDLDLCAVVRRHGLSRLVTPTAAGDPPMRRCQPITARPSDSIGASSQSRS